MTNEERIEVLNKISLQAHRAAGLLYGLHLMDMVPSSHAKRAAEIFEEKDRLEAILRDEIRPAP